MVTAGVYMVARMHVLFSRAPRRARWSSRSSARCTALLAATIALAQNDIKQVLAYSTVSASSATCSWRWASGAFAAGHVPPDDARVLQGAAVPRRGRVIHAHARRAGHAATWAGSAQDLPITYWTFLIGALAIAGIPPLAGFFSKDEILFETLRERAHGCFWIVGARDRRC